MILIAVEFAMENLLITQVDKVFNRFLYYGFKSGHNKFGQNVAYF